MTEADIINIIKSRAEGGDRYCKCLMQAFEHANKTAKIEFFNFFKTCPNTDTVNRKIDFLTRTAC